MTAASAIDELQRIVGAAHVRSAGPDDLVDGACARVVVAPGSRDEARDVLRLARAHGFSVVARGGGSKLSWGGVPSRLDLIVSTARLSRLVEHAAGDLVATAEAGMRLDDLQRALAVAGQRLALDPPEAGATLGGIIAASASGPRRLRFGSVRDLLIGITVVLADGTVARSGGKVVKNVAGYDLCKLFTGSLGTLGLIAQATFRLHPLPQAQRTVRVEVDRPEDAGSVVQALLHSSLVPSAIELTWPSPEAGGTLALLFEGTEAGVEAQAAQASTLAGLSSRAAVLDAVDGDRLWRELTLKPVSHGAVRLKLAALPANLSALVRAVFECARPAGLSPRLAGHASSGILFVDLPGGDRPALMHVVQALRRDPALADGSLVVLEAPPAVKTLLDVWGYAGDALPVMRRVKDALDPGHVLSPGRFVGGL
jgi:glycolate oxidase FAD binding subunit